MIKKIVEELQKRWAIEGNGATITLKNTGKQYNCWVSNDGTYELDDKITIWDTETYSKRFNSVEEMAAEILQLSR